MRRPTVPLFHSYACTTSRRYVNILSITCIKPPVSHLTPFLAHHTPTQIPRRPDIIFSDQTSTDSYSSWLALTIILLFTRMLFVHLVHGAFIQYPESTRIPHPSAHPPETAPSISLGNLLLLLPLLLPLFPVLLIHPRQHHQ